MVGRAQPGAKQQPLQPDLEFRKGMERRIQRDGLLADELDIGLQMVLQVFAYALDRRHHRYAQRLQQRGVGDTGELQQLRRVDGATTQDNFAARTHLLQLAPVPHLHAGRTRRTGRPVEQDPGGKRSGAQCQVAPLQRRPQVSHGGTPAPALVNRHIHGAEAFLLVPVHVLGERVTRLLAGFDEGFVERIAALSGTYVQRAGIAPVHVTSLGAGLGLAEIRQAMVVVPVRQAILFGPADVVQRMATDIDHAVDRRRAADHAATRRMDAALVHERLRLGLVHPGVARVGHGIGKARGHVDEDAVVEGARFQQQYAHLGVLGQPVGQHAAGGTGAHDDVVEWFFHAARTLQR